MSGAATLLRDTRTELATILDGWSECPIFGPNDKVKVPKLTDDDDTPAAYVAWSLRAKAEQLTFADVYGVSGTFEIWVWLEQGKDDGRLRKIQDLLAARVRAAIRDDLHFEELEEGDAIIDGPWLGQECRFTFLRVTEGP